MSLLLILFVLYIFFAFIVGTTMSAKPEHVLKRVQTFGKRKTAIAVATVTKSAQCNIKVNGIPLRQYPCDTLRAKLMEAIHVVGARRFSRMKISVSVRGGGPVCQVYAARQAIAKGLVAYYQKYSNEVEKSAIKTALLQVDKAMLIADPRRAEAKKWGRHSARSRFTKSYR